MWTLYTQGDVVLLNAIFNEVAMIASNVGLVWGFALFASIILTTKTTFGATIESHRQAAGPVLTRGAYHMVAPLVLAMALTSTDMKVTVTVENTTTGVTTSIANVPVVIAAIPVAGSVMANAVGPAITTAMSGVNPGYSDITVSGHGFIDPMRRLLAARGSIEHLGSADTELRIVLGRCLSTDAGTDFTALNNLVLNAGNTGATAAQSIPINGANPTGVGALLYQAAQNTTGLVPELASSSSTILNCTDAANLVASDISNALISVEFPRVVQGAVNGLDQPIPGADYGIGQFATEYNSMRNWNSMSGTLAIGSAQANAELINFLFDEEVTGGLNCAQASESNKTICEATMIQATELERNNLQAAANEVPMLQYAGAFGNYILALIIGLGPVIVMFMMLFGVDSGKCIKTAMHLLVWPLLVTNVGAELVNAMLTMQFSNFMTSMAQGGYLSPAAIHSTYKELSLQVGVGSHIMASLPVLMSMIFALGEAAGLSSVAAEVTPKGNETGKVEAPSPVDGAPLMRANSQSTLRQFAGGGVSIEDAGKRDAASGSMQANSMLRTASHSVSDADSREKRESAESASSRRWSEALGNRDFEGAHVNTSEGEALRNELFKNLREGGHDTAAASASTERANSHNASLNTSLGVNGGGGRGGSGGVSGGGSGEGARGGAVGAVASALRGAGSLLSSSINGTASAGASDRESLTGMISRTSDVDLAKAVSKTLSSDVGKQIVESTGGDRSKALNEERSNADSYVESVTHRDAHTSNFGQALQESGGFIASAQSIGVPQLIQQAQTNDEFGHFERMQGGKLEGLKGAQEHMALARKDMDSHSTEDVGGSPQARRAVLRHMAAASMAGDSSLPEATRFAALNYLVGEGNAMVRGGFEAPAEGAFISGAKPIALPKNTTGVAPALLRSKVSGATHGNEGLTGAQEHVDPTAKARLNSQHGAAEAAATGRLHGLEVPSGTHVSDAVDDGLANANRDGLQDGPDAKNLLSRTRSAWFHPSSAGAPSKTEAPEDAPNDKK